MPDINELPEETSPSAAHLVCVSTSAGVAKYMTFQDLADYFVSIAGGDVTAPTIVSKTVENAAPGSIVVVFSESVTVTTAGWSAKKNGSAWSISSVSGSGTTWTFVMGSSAANGDTLVISYDSSTGATVDGSSNELASVTDSSVTNNVFSGTYLTWLNLGTELETYNSAKGIRKISGGATAWTPSTSDSASNQTIATTERVVFRVPDITDTYLVGLVVDQTLVDLGGKIFGIVVNSAGSGDVQGFESNAAVGSVQDVANNDYICLFYDGSSMKYQRSTDGGSSWTTFHTSAVGASGSYYVHVQILDALSGTDIIYKI